jgi:hypothetical protein
MSYNLEWREQYIVVMLESYIGWSLEKKRRAMLTVQFNCLKSLLLSIEMWLRPMHDSIAYMAVVWSEWGHVNACKHPIPWLPNLQWNRIIKLVIWSA